MGSDASHTVNEYSLGLKPIELHYRMSFGLVFEIAHFSGVQFSMTTSKVRKVDIANLAKVEGVT